MKPTPRRIVIALFIVAFAGLAFRDIDLERDLRAWHAFGQALGLDCVARGGGLWCARVEPAAETAQPAPEDVE